MKLQVLVHTKAEGDLIELYLSSASRGTITAAWQDIENVLSRCPAAFGSAVDFSCLDEAITVRILHRLIAMNQADQASVWVITRQPLRAYYTIHPLDGFVRVWMIRRSD